MRYFRNGFRLIGLLAMLAVVLGVAHAGERCDILYVNRTDEEILSIRCKYATPYDEPRYDSSRRNLPPDGEFRLGIQGVTLPEMILIDFATKSYVFDDLSDLNTTNAMILAVVYEDGAPRLRRLDAEGEVQGEERDYLTAANRPNAMDKQVLAAVNDIQQLSDLLEARIEAVREQLGEVETFDIEAGPIWDQNHALKRCPEAIREWSEENDRPARWTGHWVTSVPGEMSLCNCMTGAADEDGTVTAEDDGWGMTAYFPVLWRSHYGAGVAPVLDPGDEKELYIALRFRLPAGGELAFLDELLGDLRLDGMRPARLTLEAWNAGEYSEDDKVDVNFRQEDDAPWSIYAMVMEALADAYESERVEGKLFWVEREAFKLAEDGEADKPIRGVLCLFSKGIFEVLLMPNARDFWEAQQDEADGR